MLRGKLHYVFFLLVGFAVATACSEDPTNPGSQASELTEAETSAIAGDVADALMGAFGSPSASGALMASVPVEEELSHTRDCPQGGTMSVSGTISGDVGEGSATLDVTGSMTFADCARGNADRHVVMDGALDLTGTVEVEAGEHASRTINIAGTLDFEVQGGDSGTCEIDLTWTTVRTDGQIDASASGTVCGRDANVDL